MPVTVQRLFFKKFSSRYNPFKPKQERAFMFWECILGGTCGSCAIHVLQTITMQTTTTTMTVLRPRVQTTRYQKKHSLTHLSWSSSNHYQLLPPTTIYSIIPLQFTCLTIFLHNLSPRPLWSTSWSGALHHHNANCRHKWTNDWSVETDKSHWAGSKTWEGQWAITATAIYHMQLWKRNVYLDAKFLRVLLV